MTKTCLINCTFRDLVYVGINDPFRLDQELLFQFVLVVKLLDKSQPFAGAMFLPDRLRPTPPRR
jgi:hypothetical protein